MHRILKVLDSCIFIYLTRCVGGNRCREQCFVNRHIFSFYERYVNALSSCREELRNALIAIQCKGGSSFDTISNDSFDSRLIVYEIAIGFVDLCHKFSITGAGFNDLCCHIFVAAFCSCSQTCAAPVELYRCIYKDRIIVPGICQAPIGVPWASGRYKLQKSLRRHLSVQPSQFPT